jgi:TolB-like protein
MTLRSCLLALAATAALGASARADDRILIIPFSAINVPANQLWVAQATQESLIADLGQVKGLIPIAFSGQVIVEDNATAARLARSNDATLAIRGSAQVVGGNIRLTAQLIDAQSGNTLRTALVTGATADLFKLEDDLAAQIRGTSAAATNAVTAVPATTTTTATYVGPVVTPAPVVIENPTPQVVVVTQPEPVYVPTYVYPYDYTYYYPTGFRIYTYDSHRDGRDRDRDRPGEHDGRGGRPGDRDDRDRPGDHGGRPGPRDNPNALPIPTSSGLPIPTKSDLPIPRNNVLPIPPKIDIPVPTRNSAPPPMRSAPPVSNSSGPVLTRSDSAPRFTPAVALPPARASVATPRSSVVTPVAASPRAAVPAISPGGPRGSSGMGRSSRNVD